MAENTLDTSQIMMEQRDDGGFDAVVTLNFRSGRTVVYREPHQTAEVTRYNNELTPLEQRAMKYAEEIDNG